MTRLTVDFSHSYDVIHLDRVPSGTAERVLTFFEGKNPPEGMVLRVKPLSGDSWVGVFPSDPSGTLDGAFTCPNPLSLLVISGGRGHFVNTEQPDQVEIASIWPIRDVRAIPNHGLLLLVGHTDIGAWGDGGMRWRTPRLAWDDVSIESVDDNAIYGSGWDAVRNSRAGFTVQILSGLVSGGAPPAQ